MGRRGNPYDNAKAESFMKTLKVEAVYPMAFETFAPSLAIMSQVAKSASALLRAYVAMLDLEAIVSRLIGTVKAGIHGKRPAGR
jgi:transposase InsO family protein